MWFSKNYVSFSEYTRRGCVLGSGKFIFAEDRYMCERNIEYRRKP